MSQQTFASLAHAEKKKVTRREEFLNEMNAVIPWQTLEAFVRPYYYKGRVGRPPFPLMTMLRIYCLQQWFGLSDPGAEEALYDMESLRRFAGIELGEQAIPDETTILNFRRFLEENELTEKMFSAVNQFLASKKLLVKTGTIVDATIIHAPSSTKNEAGKRDPEMSSTRKGNNFHFGMKAHVGTDSKSGLAHTVKVTTASVHDSKMFDQLLHGQEKEVYGDRAYVNEEKKQRFQGQGKKWRVNIKAKRGQELTYQQRKWNQSRSRVRSRVEHGFNVVKRLWGYRTVRYRGLEKNACQIYGLFMLSNLYLVRKKLLPKELLPKELQPKAAPFPSTG